MTAGNERWAVVGGGMLGLTIAHRLAQAGRDVTVYEAAGQLGGLASAWTLGDVVWDRHYHVTLLSDTHLRRLLEDLGLESSMRWVETRTGCYANGRLYSISNAVEFLRFPPLALVDKLRLAATILYASKVDDFRALEQVPVEDWLSRWSGRRTFERLWLPLLKAKLGDEWRQCSAAFIWATIQRLYAARRTGLKKEMFGYVPGGYARVLERFAEVLAAEGVRLELNAPVADVVGGDGGVEITTRSGDVARFDGAVVTANASVASRMLPGLTDDERRRLAGIRYQGIVCASVLLDRPLAPYYLTYITDEAPFTAVVEMTTMVDRDQFSGRSLVYLPRYCLATDPLMAASDAEVEERFLTGLEDMYPDFRREHVACFRVSRVKEVFALPTLGYSSRVPPFTTSQPGVHLVTSAQIVNGTLNVNETVQLAERAVVTLLEAGATSSGEAPTARSEPRGAVRVLPAGRPVQNTKPFATLSIDLDDVWTYLRTHGDAGWEDMPTYLDVVIPRVLDFMAGRRQALTWFVVGQDAALARNADLLGAIGTGGHEIGNHSFGHEPWLHRYGEPELDCEVARAEEAIGEATGRQPLGFRGPGYSLSAAALEVLARRGYRYDASTLPTFVGPVARALYFREARFGAEDRELRADLYGSFADARRPLAPYHWRVGSGTLLEVPVTTLPVLRTPVHMTYLLWLSELSPALAKGYWNAHLRLCRTAGLSPSVLLHSHDFAGRGDVDGMSFFPGFTVDPEVKLRRIDDYLDRLTATFDVVPIGRQVEALAARDDLDLVEPRFFGRVGNNGRPLTARQLAADPR